MKIKESLAKLFKTTKKIEEIELYSINIDNLSKNCYQNMFHGCKTITSATEMFSTLGTSIKRIKEHLREVYGIKGELNEYFSMFLYEIVKKCTFEEYSFAEYITPNIEISPLRYKSVHISIYPMLEIPKDFPPVDWLKIKEALDGYILILEIEDFTIDKLKEYVTLLKIMQQN